MPPTDRHLIAAQVAAMREFDRSVTDAEAHTILSIIAPHMSDGKLFYCVRPATRALVRTFDLMTPRDQIAMMARVRPLITAAKDAQVAYRIQSQYRSTVR